MTAGHPLQADEILLEHQPHSYLPVVGLQPRAREDLTSYCPNQYDQLEIHIYLLDIVYIWSTDWRTQYTDSIELGHNMRVIIFLTFGWGLFHGVTSSVLRDKVISSFLNELKGKEFQDPEFVQILEVIMTKVQDNGEECIKTEASRCVLRITTSTERASRAVSKTRRFLTQLIGNVTKTTFPKLNAFMTDIFANGTSIGTDMNTQFDASASIIMLKTLEKISTFLQNVNAFKAPVLTLLSLTLVFTAIFLASGTFHTCIAYRTKRKTAKMQRYEAYYQRRQRALEM